MKAHLWAPVLLVSGYLLLIVSWVMSNPPGAAPDEYAHYLRAVGAGRGELVPGRRQGPLTGADRSKIYLRWQRLQTRMIKVSGRFSPESINCNQTAPRASWQCTQPRPPADQTFQLRSWVGTYPPYAYILPGLAMRLGSETVSALLWGRLASGLTSATLLALAVLVLWDRRRSWICMLGLIAAVTPMVIFVGSSLTASGPEIAAGVGFTASLLRLGRREHAPPGVWAVAAVAGAVLVVSRDLGLLWLGLNTLVFLGFSGLKQAYRTWRSAGLAGLAVVVVLACAAVAAAVSQVRVQVRPRTDLARLLSSLGPVFPITKEIARQQIGVFGSLDTVLPGAIYLLWAFLILALVALALMAGSGRQRMVVAGTGTVVFVLPLLIDAVQQQVGFGAQGRHVLPVSVALPLVAGEVLYRNSEKLRWLRPLRPAFWYSLSAAGAYFVSWYVNARRRVVGYEGPLLFWKGLRSTPPYGWPAWALVALAAALVIVGFGYLASSSRPAQA